jgi:Xaa-Pro aminopeptidase
MNREGFDAVLIFGGAAPQPDWIRYFSNYVQPFPVGGAFLFISAIGTETLLVDCPWNLKDAKKMSWIEDIRAFPHGRYRWQFEEVRKLLGDLFRQAGVAQSRVGVCSMEMPSLSHQALQTAIPEAHLEDAVSLWSQTVSAPSEYDVSMIRQTAKIADFGMATALSGCHHGAIEYEICVEAMRSMASMGAEFLHGGGPSTHINIGSGSQVLSNVRPFLFTTRELSGGDMFWLDLSASYAGYYVDFDRTVCVGEPTTEQQRIYDASKGMYDALLEAIRPGVTGAEVFEKGFQVAKETGFEDRFNLIYLGHMSGITTSERPFLIPEETMELPEGGFINIEPGIFDPGVGTSSLEDIILIGPDKGEPITKHNLDLHVV